jgi:hypothetical protein
LLLLLLLHAAGAPSCRHLLLLRRRRHFRLLQCLLKLLIDVPVINHFLFYVFLIHTRAPNHLLITLALLTHTTHITCGTQEATHALARPHAARYGSSSSRATTTS